MILGKSLPLSQSQVLHLLRAVMISSSVSGRIMSGSGPQPSKGFRCEQDHHMPSGIHCYSYTLSDGQPVGTALRLGAPGMAEGEEEE